MTIYDTLMARYRATTGSLAEQWRALMSAIGLLIVTYDNLPDLLRARLALVNTAWSAGSVDAAFLRAVEIECWEFLDAKHGNSTAIVDQEDRAVRAMLCLLEPNGDALAASDTANWVDEMLNPV
jgi:hypothetical protein